MIVVSDVINNLTVCGQVRNTEHDGIILPKQG